MRSIVGRSRSRARATGPGPGSTAEADFGVVGVLGVVRYTIPVPVRGRSSRGALPEPDGTALADALRPIVIGAPLVVRALVVVAEAAAVEAVVEAVVAEEGAARAPVDEDEPNDVRPNAEGGVAGVIGDSCGAEGRRRPGVDGTERDDIEAESGVRGDAADTADGVLSPFDMRRPAPCACGRRSGRGTDTLRGVVGDAKFVTSRGAARSAVARRSSRANERLPLRPSEPALVRGWGWGRVGRGSAGVVGVATLAVEDDVEGLRPSSPSRMWPSDLVESDVVSSVRRPVEEDPAGADRYDDTDARD